MSRALIVAGGIGGALLAGGTWVLVWAFRDGNRRLNKALDEAADPGVDILAAEPITGMTINEAAALGSTLDEHAATAMALVMADVHGAWGVGPDREWCDLTAEQEATFDALTAGLGGAE